MSTRRLAVVSAGLGQPSSTRLLADRLAEATERALYEYGVQVSVDVVELRDHAHDITNAMVSGIPTGDLRRALDSVANADGVIAVSPIFSASYSGLFKSFFDVVDPDWLAGTPVLVAATGGTPRHSLALEHALRPLFTYLRAIVVPTAVYAASQDWASEDSCDDGLTERIDRASGELATLIAGGRPQRQSDPFDEPTPFEDLLAR